MVLLIKCWQGVHNSKTENITELVIGIKSDHGRAVFRRVRIKWYMLRRKYDTEKRRVGSKEITTIHYCDNE